MNEEPWYSKLKQASASDMESILSDKHSCKFISENIDQVPSELLEEATLRDLLAKSNSDISFQHRALTVKQLNDLFVQDNNSLSFMGLGNDNSLTFSITSKSTPENSYTQKLRLASLDDIVDDYLTKNIDVLKQIVYDEEEEVDPDKLVDDLIEHVLDEASNGNIEVDCSCPSQRFLGFRHFLNQDGALYTSPGGSRLSTDYFDPSKVTGPRSKPIEILRAPRDRNQNYVSTEPGQAPVNIGSKGIVCKHLHFLFTNFADNQPYREFLLREITKQAHTIWVIMVKKIRDHINAALKRPLSAKEKLELSVSLSFLSDDEAQQRLAELQGKIPQEDYQELLNNLNRFREFQAQQQEKPFDQSLFFVPTDLIPVDTSIDFLQTEVPPVDTSIDFLQPEVPPVDTSIDFFDQGVAPVDSSELLQPYEQQPPMPGESVPPAPVETQVPEPAEVVQPEKPAKVAKKQKHKVVTPKEYVDMVKGIANLPRNQQGNKLQDLSRYISQDAIAEIASRVKDVNRERDFDALADRLVGMKDDDKIAVLKNLQGFVSPEGISSILRKVDALKERV